MFKTSGEEKLNSVKFLLGSQYTLITLQKGGVAEGHTELINA